MYWLTWEKFLFILFFATVFTIFYYRKLIFTPLYLEYKKLEAECHYLLLEPIARKIYFHLSYKKDLSRFNHISTGLAKPVGKHSKWGLFLYKFKAFFKNLTVFYQHPVNPLGNLPVF